MAKTLREIYRSLKEDISIPPNLKKPGIGKDSGQHEDPVTGRMNMQTKSLDQAIKDTPLNPVDGGLKKLNTNIDTSKPVPKIDTPIMDKAVAAKAAQDKAAAVSNAKTQRSGAPAGGNYQTAVRKNVPSSAREPDEKTGSTGGRSGFFGMAQARRDNMAAGAAAKSADKIAQQRRDSKLGASAVAYQQKTGEGIANGVKQRNADAMAARGKMAPSAALDKAAVAGTRGPWTRDEKWKQSINDPATQSRANGDKYRPAPGTLGDKLNKVASGTNSPSERAPNQKATAGQAQAATPAKAPKTTAALAAAAKVRAGQAQAPAAKQSFGQAFAAARKKAGGSSGVFTYNGKQYQTNVKGEKYKVMSKLKKV